MARSVWILMLAALFATLGCERNPTDRAPAKVTSEDVRRDAGQALNTAVEYSQQTREEFQKKLESQLNELDAKIAKLRENGSELKGGVKVKWDGKMAELEMKREVARAKLAEIGQSSAEAWKDVQKGAQSARDDLDKAFRDASREF
jgi:LPS O-antigen subunit length determinant protein (WzzB/FepE family)